ncbi:MAG: dephospho-CoA kinase [Rhizomicrobium sp.]
MAKPFVIGLTGGIGMGKSETAKLFAAEGVLVHDSDAAIDRLYAQGGAGVEAIGKRFPAAVRGGAVDRAALSGLVLDEPAALEWLEKLVHPLVTAEREQFLRLAKAPIVLFDIPLLFETGLEAQMDAVVVVSAPETMRRARVLKRDAMTAEKFERLRRRQWDDAKRRQQADYVVTTDKGLDQARQQVKMILADIRKKRGPDA